LCYKKRDQSITSKKEISLRIKKLKNKNVKHTNGALTKYARLVSQANTGATTT
jgi:dihydroxyacid dehydratase/phosphogluconate dehydratase